MDIAMASIAVPIFSSGSYPATTANIDAGITSLTKGGTVVPEAVVFIGTYGAYGKLIVNADLNRTYWMTVSFVGSAGLAQDLYSNHPAKYPNGYLDATNSSRILISQIVPLPYNSSLKLVADYTAQIQKVDPGSKADFGSFEVFMITPLSLLSRLSLTFLGIYCRPYGVSNIILCTCRYSSRPKHYYYWFLRCLIFLW